MCIFVNVTLVFTSHLVWEIKGLMNFSTSLQTEKLSMGDFFFVKLLKPTAPMIVAVGECL